MDTPAPASPPAVARRPAGVGACAGVAALLLWAAAGATQATPAPAPTEPPPPLAEQLQETEQRVAAANSPEQDLPARLDAAFDAAGVPGAAVALVERGETTLVHATGVADVASGRPVTADTLFRAGSVSKMVTGVVVMQLVQEGRLSLDDTVAMRAPWLRFDNPWESTQPLRVVHLLEHTTGWADLSPREFAIDDASLSVADALAVGGVRVSRYPPGEFHAYTSAGYGVIQRIVEDITGRPFADVARERVFAPLGMTSARYDLPPTLAASHLPGGEAVSPQRYPLLAAAGLVVDAGDLARFVRFLVDGRADDGRVLLTPDSLQRMETAETTLAARAGVPHGYGIGDAGYVGPHAVFRGHGGAIDAFSAELRYARDCRCGYVVLANGGRIPAPALTAIEERLRPPASTAAPLADDAPPFADLAAFAGVYQPVGQRNRMLAPVDAMTTFARGAPTQDGRFAFDGVVRPVDEAGRLRRPDRVAPTLALVRHGDGRLAVGTTGNWRRVPLWTVGVKALWVAALVAGLVVAVGLALAAHWRRRSAALAWGTVAAVLPLPVLLALFAVAAGLPPARSIATFAAPTPLSIAVAATTIALPVAALWLLWRALRSRAAGPATRTVAGVVALLLLFASVWLAGWGWIGLRTWTL